MPHNQLKIVGGAVVTETPVVNQTGYSTTNRIRFLPDPQGLSLAQKLGGWARFFASTITAGVVRALWGWQDTSNNKWIALGADSSLATSEGLQVIQCTVNGSTGLTSATGSLRNITPFINSDGSIVSVQSTAGSNIFTVQDFYNSPGVPPEVSSVYFVTPVSVGGVVLSGVYPIVPHSLSAAYTITATDALGNPASASYTTIIASDAITGVTFAAGTPNTLTIAFTGGGYIFQAGQNVRVLVADNTITGDYIVLSSAANSVTVATTLSSYTFSTSGAVSNNGVVPIFQTTSGSSVVTVVFPSHGNVVGEYFFVLTPTLVGGITLQGQYAVDTVPNSYTFTITAAASATATSQQYQGAMTVSGGSRSGTAVTLNTVAPTGFVNPVGSTNVLVQGVNPATWNGYYNVTAQTTTAVTYTDASATGTWVSGGSYSSVGGYMSLVYSRSSTTTIATDAYPSAFWTLDNWGNDLIACSGASVAFKYASGFSVLYQPIFYWDSTGPYIYASAINTGPVVNMGAFVAMPQRQIIAWGSSFGGIIDPLLIRWCDVNNFNTWAAQVVNQAGSFRLPSGSAIIGARQVFQQGLIWTDIELWSMTYINQPYVYSFNKIGQGCGLIGKYAHGVLGGVVYWMGKSQFFMTSGEGVQPLPCPVWDVAFQDLDLVNVGKITCATNAMFNEVAWYFPIKGGTGENSNYVKYNTVAGVWDFGVLDRSAWIDVSVLQQPIGFSPANSLIYQHEISPDADGAAMGETFTTGWFALAEGDVMPYVDQFWIDMKWGYYNQTQNASVTMSFAAQAYPGAMQYSYGPYTVSQSTAYISPRIRNRLVNFTVSGTGTGTWWRLGGIRYRVAPDGKY